MPTTEDPDQTPFPCCAATADPSTPWCGSCHVDTLTGLLDRWAWDTAAARSLAGNGCPTLLLVYIDSFKAVNDLAGHQAGDAVLRAVADVMRASTRENDLLGRYGGDEFMVLLVDPCDAEAVTSRIHAGVDALDLRSAVPELHAGGLSMVSVTIGTASHPPEGATLADLVQRADSELRRRKQHVHDKIHTIAPETFLERMLSANHLLHGDWITDVLLALSDEPLRYTELLDRIRSSPVIDKRTRRDRHVHPRILVHTLRRMEDDGLLVRREECDQVPRSVSYTLTQAGLDLLQALAATVMWCERHKAVVELAERRAADRHAS